MKEKKNDQRHNEEQDSKPSGFGVVEVAGGVGSRIAGAAGAAKKAAVEGVQIAGGAIGDKAIAAGNAIGGAAENTYVAFGGRTNKETRGTLKGDDGQYRVPDPVLNKIETDTLDEVTAQYKKMVTPNALAKLGKKAGDAMPTQIKEVLDGAKTTVAQQKYYMEALKLAASGFKAIEEHASKMSVSDEYVLKEINKSLKNERVASIDEICLLRSYDVAKVAGSQKYQHLWLALVEGAATGAPGFAGLPFNLVLSNFLLFRAVQSIAMFYGYDVKNKPSELEIASQVYMEAIAPSDHGAGAVPSIIGRVMIAAEAEVVRSSVKKGWQGMASRGGASLLIAQMRALSNNAARKAVEAAGQKGLEGSVFANVLEQIGKRMGQKNVAKGIPAFGAIFGAAFDAGAINRIVDFANLFYQKRFILEKEVRVAALIEDKDVNTILDVENVQVEEDKYEDFTIASGNPADITE